MDNGRQIDSNKFSKPLQNQLLKPHTMTSEKIKEISSTARKENQVKVSDSTLLSKNLKRNTPTL